MLYPVLPKVAGATIRRALFVSEQLHAVLNSPEGTDEWEKRIGYLRADLEVFVSAATITPKYLFHLYPARDGVWEIRSTKPDPSIRVMGLFAAKDILVCTNYAIREDLGGWQSREWKEAKRQTAAQWRVLFHSYGHVIEHDVKRLVSGALDGKYFKGEPPGGA